MGVVPVRSKEFIERPPVSLDDAHLVDTFKEAEAALLSRDLRQGLWDSPAAKLIHDTITDLDAEPHFQRRRVETGLFVPEALSCFEFQTVIPALRASIAHYQNVLGHRADLMPIVRAALIQVASKLVGVDGIESPEAAERFWGVFAPVRRGLRIQWNTAQGEERTRLLNGSFEGQSAFGQSYVSPSIVRRRTASLAENARNPDLLSLMMAGADRDDEDLIREVTVFFSASIGTASYVSCRSFWELSKWVAKTPTDQPKLQDKQFLSQVVNETARLYPPSPYVIRRALRHTRVVDREVREGEYVIIHLYQANRDPEAYGPNADEFDPHRTPVAIRHQPFGLAFGGGPHMCIGKPLAVGRHAGTQGDDAPIGLVARIVTELVSAGVTIDPNEAPVIGQPGMHEEDTFPVILPGNSARN